MTINLSMPVNHELRPRISVVGVGGAGTNAVNNMITAHSKEWSSSPAIPMRNRCAQSLTERRIQLGTSMTQGLGAGARPEIGRAAAEEAVDEMLDQLQGSHMVFITAGMGGGTGTGAAPVIARAAREQGILTVGVVTKPFHFEGAHRMRVAEGGSDGAAAVRRHADRHSEPEPVPHRQRAHHLRRGVQARRQRAAHGRARRHRPDGDAGPDQPRLRRHPHRDERDGQGDDGHRRGHGERRAIEAAEAAISNPLLDEVSMRGARGVLINITGGADMTLFEVDEAANRIKEEVDPDANIIVGSTLDESLDGEMRVSVVATGIEVREARTERRPPPPPRRRSKPGASASFRLRPQMPKLPSAALFPLKAVVGGGDREQPVAASRLDAASGGRGRECRARGRVGRRAGATRGGAAAGWQSRHRGRGGEIERPAVLASASAAAGALPGVGPATRAGARTRAGAEPVRTGHGELRPAAGSGRVSRARGGSRPDDGRSAPDDGGGGSGLRRPGLPASLSRRRSVGSSSDRL